MNSNAPADTLNNTTMPNVRRKQTIPANLRSVFTTWFSEDKSIKGFNLQATLDCIDYVSKFAKRRNISCNIWNISEQHEFDIAYERIIKSRQLERKNKNMYVNFYVIGHYYKQFLEEKPWEQIAMNIDIKKEQNKTPRNTQKTVASTPTISDNKIIKIRKTSRDATEYILIIDTIQHCFVVYRENDCKVLHVSPLCNPPCGRRGIHINRKNLETHVYFEIDTKNFNKLVSEDNPLPDITNINSHYVKKNYENIPITHSESDVRIGNFVTMQQLKIEDIDSFNRDNIERSMPVLLTKTVDWSLLNYGFTLPQSSIDVFCENLIDKVQPGSSCRINLILEGMPYPATFINVNTQRSSSRVMQVRYVNSSKIDVKIKEIFNMSFNFIIAKREGRQSKLIENREYIEVVSVSPNVFEIICYPFRLDDDLQYVTPQFESISKQEQIIAYDPTLIQKIRDVLMSHFSNGFRIDSPVELMRFKSLTEDMFPDNIDMSDDALQEHIISCGIVFEGKLYVISNDTKDKIQNIVDEYLNEGAKIIFYSELYTMNENWLFSSSVVSEKMLTNILRELFPRLSFYKAYFGYKEVNMGITLKNEILRVWGDNILQSYKQLNEKLKFIPANIIKQTLGTNGDFIWNNVGCFTHISKIEINDDEKKAICVAADSYCTTNGYISATELPLGGLIARYVELSITAIHSAAYRICLSDKYIMKGKIITRNNNVLDAYELMLQYCHSIEKCTLDDLLKYEIFLTGECHRYIPMGAAYSTLIRIDKNTFVSDKYVNFDIDKTDDAIEIFVKENYVPLKSFTVFSTFPECGQTWNLFLLESYCRRFSHKFRFDTPAVNSRNVGAVIRKECTMDYRELVIDAAAKADIPLTDDAIGNFFFDSGYLGKRKLKNIADFVNDVKKARERRS